MMQILGDGTASDHGGVSPAHVLPTICPLSSIQTLEPMMCLPGGTF